MSAENRFGIDLGTTNSAIARSNGIEVRGYQNNDQMSVTPSAVRILKSGRLFVGKRAYNAILEDPENVATEFKRLMGQKTRKSFPAAGRSMSPEELSAEVLKSLKDDVHRQTGEEIHRAVITVPAAFGTLQCEATSSAAALAGIPETYLLQEPIAASIAYGVEPRSWNQYWLVFDLGGGTLDIAVVSTRDGRLTVLEHRGNNLLGGKDMDRMIVEQVLLPALEREFKLPERASPERLRLLRRLLILAEEAKIDLSTSDRIVVSIVNVGPDICGKPIETEVEVHRTRFEGGIGELVQGCVRLALEALSAARLTGADLDRVLLVGGPTRIPYLKVALADGLGAKLDSSIDPMTVVASGAALFASSVDWARTAARSASLPGRASLLLGYEKVSSAIQAPVNGRVQPIGDIEAIKIDAEGGYWTSGWIRLVNGTFEIRVQLMEGKQTEYWVYARRPDGTLVDLDPNSFSLRHGLVAAAPPLPHSIGIEVVRTDGKSELDIIFRKGHPLPAEHTFTYRAAHELRPSQPDDFLAIKIWEGETPEDPDANLWVGAMRIYGRNVQRAIPEGAEIRLTVRIGASRRVSVDAFLPHSNAFSDGIYLPDREQQDPSEQIKKLPSSIGPLLERLDAVEAITAERGDAAASEEVARLRRDVEEVDLSVSGLRGHSDDPDAPNRSLELERDIRKRLALLEKETGAGGASATEIEQVKRKAGPAKEVTGKFGSDADKHELAKLIRDLERAGSRSDARSARRIGEQIESLRWRVLFDQDWYWKEALEAQQRIGRKFQNQQEAKKWLDAGAEAARKGDALSLREAVKHLWKLQPKSDTQLDRERIDSPGLSKS